MDREHFVDLYPRLFHMAVDGAWPSVQERGLLSTAALVDLYDPPPAVRAQILNGVRRTSVALQHDGLPDVLVRDQRPLKFIDQCLLPGTTLQEFLDALNGRVFFWVSLERLRRLMGATAYKRHPQTVLEVDTAKLLAAHPQVDLAPYNTGSVHVPNMPARGPETFVRLEDYPYEQMAKRRGRSDAVVELTVPYASPNVVDAVLTVTRWEQGEPTSQLFPQR
ncbi:hypothetical protein [Cellulomonas sp. IC4_254]|uniref:DUF7002 family protein n=1 Tax=Cellulomonas sp. IC4_254 TaxID=2714040 RepID=UPI00141E7464|nr:hypothetical protein [Cellulomonas sp. IC4_254]NHT16136.1 hypothetical protein [Cellulomonas sp. IC4_254]